MDDSGEEGSVIELNGRSLKREGIFPRGSRFNVCKSANVDPATKPEVRISSFRLRGWGGGGDAVLRQPLGFTEAEMGEGAESRGEGHREVG